jgi:hypothetical protein
VNERITRRTERWVDLPNDLETRLPKRYDEQKLFRPAAVIETYVETLDGEKTYTVEFRGPVQTKAGKDHGLSRGEASYTSSGGWRSAPIKDIPQELKAFVVGADAMRVALDRVANATT